MGHVDTKNGLDHLRFHGLEMSQTLSNMVRVCMPKMMNRTCFGCFLVPECCFVPSAFSSLWLPSWRVLDTKLSIYPKIGWFGRVDQLDPAVLGRRTLLNAGV